MENNRKHNRDEDNEKSIIAKITSRNTLVLITLNAFVGVALLLGSVTSNPMVYVFGEEDRRGDKGSDNDNDGHGDGDGSSEDLSPIENNNSPSKGEDEDDDNDDGGHGSGDTPDLEGVTDTPDLSEGGEDTADLSQIENSNSPSKDDDNSGKGDEGRTSDLASKLAPLDNTKGFDSMENQWDDTDDLAQLDNTNSDGSFEAGSDPDRTFIHYTEKIAIELSNLTPFELKEYPITELSDEDLKSVLECLTTDNLAKVLLNIPKEDLAEIQDMLNAITFDEIQKMLSEELM